MQQARKGEIVAILFVITMVLIPIIATVTYINEDAPKHREDSWK